MHRAFRTVALTCLLASACTRNAHLPGCAPDSVRVGTICVDKYEASVWQIPPSDTRLVGDVQSGSATLASLAAGGATQLAVASDLNGSCRPPMPATFPGSGNWTATAGSTPPSPGIYAVSIPGVRPSGCLSWFQANQACLLSGKRLLTNVEWQGAAAGTPDPGTDDGITDCHVLRAAGDYPASTGSRSACMSSWGVFDLVGNLPEWVADWADVAADCTSWALSGITGDDESCFGGGGFQASDLRSGIPSALVRGGGWASRGPGVFAVSASFPPSLGAIPGLPPTGFRCGR